MFFALAEICTNGHVTNLHADTAPERNQRFCCRCGATTITRCERCSEAIRGPYRSASMRRERYMRPAYCHACGTAYPWTAQRLATARAFADELRTLNKSQREALKASLDDLVAETPGTELAVHRFKHLMAKAGSAVAESMREILTDVMVESTRRAIWGG